MQEDMVRYIVDAVDSETPITIAALSAGLMRKFPQATRDQYAKAFHLASWYIKIRKGYIQ